MPKKAKHGQPEPEKLAVIDARRGIFKWGLRVRVTLPNGESKRPYGTFEGTESQARKRIQEMRLEYERRGLVTSKEALRTFIQDYLDRRSQGIGDRQWSLRTQTTYRNVSQRHILPNIGDIKIGEVNRRIVEDFFVTLRASGLSTVVLRHAKTILSGALDLAMRDEVIPFNAVRGVRIERTKAEVEAEGNKRKHLTRDEAERLFPVLIAHHAGIAFAFQMMMGLRIGEVLGLRWVDVDLEKRLVHIGNTRSQGEGMRYEGPPKSSTSKRTLPLTQDGVELLLEQRRRQDEQRVANLPGWVDSGYVFTTQRGTARYGDNIKRYMAPLCKQAGVAYINPHGMRHTYATLVLSEGARVERVSKFMGHSRTSVTQDIYRHVEEWELEGLSLSLRSKGGTEAAD